MGTIEEEMIGIFAIGTTTTRRIWDYIYLEHDDMSKGLKIMSLGVINHGISLSVQTNFEKTMFVQA